MTYDHLIFESPGKSFAYLTDFRESSSRLNQLIEFISDVDVLVCENSYCFEDEQLAKKNFHMTSRDVGELAKSANVGELILFHLSDRYTSDQWLVQLEEVREIFPKTRWPEAWTHLANNHNS